MYIRDQFIPKMTKTLKIYCLFSIGLIVILSLLNYIDLNIKGDYTYLLLAWFWIFCTIYVIITNWKLIYVKIYTILLAFLIFLSILPMAIPFFVILSFLTNSNVIQKVPINKEYKIELRKQVLGMERVYIYKTTSKLLVLEKTENLCRPDYLNVLGEVLNMNEEHERLYKLKDSPIQDAKLISVNKDSIGIEYQILNKKKIIYHHLKEDYGY